MNSFSDESLQTDRKQLLTMQEGLCWDEEGSRAHPEQGDELQEPEAVGQHKERQHIKNRSLNLKSKT